MFFFFLEIVDMNRSSHWKCINWKGLLQKSCCVILPTESLGKNPNKCLKKIHFSVKLQAYSLLHCQNEIFHKHFSAILRRNHRIPIWLSVAASEDRLSLICLLVRFIAIIELLNWLLNWIDCLFIGINIWIYIEICDSNVCDSIDTILSQVAYHPLNQILIARKRKQAP